MSCNQENEQHTDEQHSVLGNLYQNFHFKIYTIDEYLG